MRSTFVMAGIVAAVLVAPAEAQTRRAPAEETRVQMPVRGRVSVIGVRLTDVTPETLTTHKLPKLEGAIVESVNPNSPAAAAGLRQHDVIVQFDGERVRSASHLTRLVAETPAGREVLVGVMRDGRRTDIRLTPEAGNSWFDPRFGGTIDLDSAELREQVERAGRAARELGLTLPEVVEGGRGMAANRAQLGVHIQEVSGELAEYFGVKEGLLIASVVPDSAAAKAGVRVGDVITAVGGKPVTSARELIAALPAGEGSQTVTLTIVRDKKELSLNATLAAAPARTRAPRGQRV